ncbi:MAG: ABC transporter ATP-binding protein [Candidatus Thorarchaeota archaeon]|nr:MAG: ABC transporter ATP-binding protein [Candidatus Thorarchaeota archaeon]
MSSTNEVILSTDGLTKSFGGLVAVSDVSLDVERGAIKAIIGPNGSGKTTLFNLITGALPPSSGRVYFEGQDITGFSMHQRTRRGISRSYQITNIFPYQTTFENIRLAVQGCSGRQVNFYGMLKKAGEYSEFHEKVIDIAAIVGLDAARLYVPAALIPHADQRKLEIAMALATEPKLLLLDEPAAGMSIEEIPDVIDAIVRVKESYGDELTLLVVEHKMDIVMRLSEEIFVLSEGRMIAKGTPKEIQENEQVLTAYLGGTDEELA